MGFINDVRTIIAAVPKDRQTMLFSATISNEIRDLSSDILRNPHTVEAGEQRDPAATITQHFYTCSPHGKMDLLVHALEAEKMNSVLVFSRTKHGADKVARRLAQKGISSAAIHSNRTQSQRQRALDGFKEGKFRVLVATDIAARGIDVDGISHVVNFDIPQFAEDYIHRIGRTGRAGSTGDAITFVTRDDQQFVRGIERFTGRKAEVKVYEGFTPPPQSDNRPAREHAPARSHGPERHRRPQTGRGGSTGRNSHTATIGYKQSTRPQSPGAVHNHPGQATTPGYPPHKKKNDRRHPQNAKGGKRKPFEFGRKRKPAGRLDAFSSDGGSGWSNY